MMTQAGFEPPTKLLVKGQGREGGLTEKSLAIGESIHPNTLLKQEGLQLAEASFRENGAAHVFVYSCSIFFLTRSSTPCTSKSGKGSPVPTPEPSAR